MAPRHYLVYCWPIAKRGTFQCSDILDIKSSGHIKERCFWNDIHFFSCCQLVNHSSKPNMVFAKQTWIIMFHSAGVRQWSFIIFMLLNNGLFGKSFSSPKILNFKNGPLQWVIVFAKLPITLKAAVNTLRSRQNVHHFADDILKCIFLNENACFHLKFHLRLFQLTIYPHRLRWWHGA